MLYRNLKLKSKLVFYGILMVVVPLCLFCFMMFFLDSRMKELVNEKASLMAESDLDHIVQNVYATCSTTQALVQNEVNNALNVARNLLSSQGGVVVEGAFQQWTAVNQYTKEKRVVTLPGLVIGGNPIIKNISMKIPSLFVDKVKSLVGGTCTVFQRMDEDGSMLRVSTNVIKEDGSRAVGTYIPARNPDGSANPVIAEIMAGKTFKGRAFVVDQWYIAAYEPMYDSTQHLVGVLYVGIPQESVDTLRKAVMNTKVGQSGYVAVLDGDGQYAISKDGKRDGEQVKTIKTSDGKFPIQELIQQAKQLSSGMTGGKRYLWQNSEGSQETEKMVRFMYFKPWDWIILAGAPEQELNAVARDIDHAILKKIKFQFILAVVVLVLVAAIWYLVAGQITAPLTRAVKLAKEMSEGDFTGRLDEQRTDETGELSRALNTMAQNLGRMCQEIREDSETLAVSAQNLSTEADQINETSSQAAEKSAVMAGFARKMSVSMEQMESEAAQTTENIQTIVAAVSQMTTTIEEISKNTSKGNAITEKAVNQAQQVSNQVNELGHAATEIGKITQTIVEISSQTGLLALNATIEAARAGQAGKGFAVVADEIKNLSVQTAKATGEISGQITTVQQTIDSSVKSIESIVSVIQNINDIVTTVAAAVEEQSASTREISGNVEKAAEGVNNMETNVRSTALTMNDMSESILVLKEAADQAGSGSSQVLNNAIKLRELSKALYAQMERFRT